MPAAIPCPHADWGPQDVVDTMECSLSYRRRFRRTSRAPLALMTQRSRLDQFLLQKAAEAGADVRDGVKVADASP